MLYTKCEYNPASPFYHTKKLIHSFTNPKPFHHTTFFQLFYTPEFIKTKPSRMRLNVSFDLVIEKIIFKTSHVLKNVGKFVLVLI